MADFAERVQAFAADIEKAQDVGGGPGFLVTGNAFHRADLIEMIEALGGRIVGLDTCIGVRQYDGLVEEDAPDAMLALAERYLLKAPCARIEGFGERISYIMRLAEKSKADGVVECAVKYCDTHAYEVPLIKQKFEEAGIPFLHIETDYEPAGLEQMRTRVEAFLQVVRGRGSG